MGSRQAERFGRLEDDDQLEGRRLLDRQAAGPGALEEPVHVAGGPPPLIAEVRRIRNETTVNQITNRGGRGQGASTLAFSCALPVPYLGKLRLVHRTTLERRSPNDVVAFMLRTFTFGRALPPRTAPDH